MIFGIQIEFSRISSSLSKQIFVTEL